MIPGYIQDGTYAGNGVCLIGVEDSRGSPFECTVEIVQNRDRFMISGHYRGPTDIAKHRFSGSFGAQRRTLVGQTDRGLSFASTRNTRLRDT